MYDTVRMRKEAIAPEKKRCVCKDVTRLNQTVLSSITNCVFQQKWLKVV